MINGLLPSRNPTQMPQVMRLSYPNSQLSAKSYVVPVFTPPLKFFGRYGATRWAEPFFREEFRML